MNEITNSLIAIAETMASPIQTVNRAAFKIARDSQPTPKEKTETKHIFIPSPPPIVPWAHNFKNVHDNRDLLNDSFNADFEYLVKVQISVGLQKGQHIILQTNEGPASYVVYKKIATQGLVSYALKPLTPDQPPIIVFRCTEPDPKKEHSFHSMQNDTDENLGERGWLAARKTFEVLMADREFRTRGQKVKVGGYSLGGAHAQYFIAEHHRRVSHGIFYCDPSIRADVAEDFAKNVQEPIVLQIFRTWGDPYTHFGGKHLGWGVDHPNVQVQLLEINVHNQDRFDSDLHSKRIFSTQNYDYTVQEFTDAEILIKKLDNTARDPVTHTVENMRRRHGWFLSKFLGAASSLKTSFINFFEDEARVKKK